MKVTVYTTTYCAWCRRAEQLLDRRRIAYTTIDVTNDPDARDTLVERANGRTTVPVIFFDDRVIGGYQELANLDAAGGLVGLAGPAEGTGKS
jgi:glutaredoxin 3